MQTRAQGVDWGAIWAGALLSLGLLIWLGAIALALGWWALAPEAPQGAPLGTGASAMIGIGLTALAFAAGGWLSGQRAGMAPGAHGLLAGVLGTMGGLFGGAFGLGGIVGSLMGPLNLQVFAQRALQGLNGPAAVSNAAGGLAAWFAAAALVAIGAAWLGAILAPQPVRQRQTQASG
ncbi:MAG: hypothetical protein H7338_19955 [Candidatus Sericytochromatia bacterium]|nr:hypothetical protein [Candidatus Sericytochromatia bacterium]